MRILFIYPNITRATSPQLGICMLAGVARQSGHECSLYDLTTIPEGEEIPAFHSKLESFAPDLLAVSCRSNEWSFLEQLFESVNLEGIPKVFGGPHATVAPEQVIKIADILVIGEGEETFAQILKKIDHREDTNGIAGCWVKQDDKIFKNEVTHVISALDELPFPHWRIFDDIHYSSSFIKRHFKGANIAGAFEASRGCPYACAYCTNDYVRSLYRGKGKWRREKSPERILQEVSMFRDEYGLDCVYWIDEVMLTNIDRLRRFRDLYRSEIGTPFVFMERPENMTDEKVRIIREAGAQMVSIGIESGDENIRRNLLNRKHSQETIISAFRTAKKHGLITHAFTMIGFPGEGRDSIKKTYKLVNEVQPEIMQTTIFYPLRKTKLYEKVVGEGLFDAHTPMPTEYYTKSALTFSGNRHRELLLAQYVLTNYKNFVISLFGLFMLSLPAPFTSILYLVIRSLHFCRRVYNKLFKQIFPSVLT